MPAGGKDIRPSPEALLALATSEERGRLKIFLGAAPGVGKTYEMLQTAQARRREGVDVVVGVVETHGRVETSALLAGLEILPRRRVEYRGQTLEEFDLDAALARRPALLLVDELAHTNAAGSRHPKRYLDVDELRSAGIDVYTTLNIQHVESLSDVVASITGVRVRETVPDSVLDGANDIEVVDLAPEDLLQRLREGKVYVPEMAQRALDGYFAPGNLTALRELALRRTVQRVDEQLLSHMREHAIRGPWAAGERVLVYLSAHRPGAPIVRYGKRLADQFHAPWTVLCIETSDSALLDDARRDGVAESVRLAERLGATTLALPGRDVAGEILRYARENNVTQIVVERPRRSRWSELVRESVAQSLVRRAGRISVHVMGDPEASGEPAIARSVPAWRRQPVQASGYLAAIGLVAASLCAGLFLYPFVGSENVDLVFVPAVMAVATRFGLVPSLFAAVLSSLALNFFFIPPVYTLTVGDPKNVASLLLFTAVGIVISNLGSRMHAEAKAAYVRTTTTQALYEFSRKIAAVADLEDLLWAAAFQIASMLKLDVVFLLPENGSLRVAAAYPPEDRLDDADLAAALWAWDRNHPAGRGADTLPGAKRLFLPLQTARGAVGAVGLAREKPGELMTPDERRLLDALLDQTAVAVERFRLAEDFDRTRLAADRERLRAALLTSLSHDLKTPLASIIGAASALGQEGAPLDEGAQRDLVRMIHEEAERLSRFVHNLLDMTKLESGSIELAVEAVDLSELVGSALERTARFFTELRVDVELAPDLPMIMLDPVLFEQVLFNLLDNASRYAPRGSVVRIAGRRHDGGVRVEISDEGPGIPQDDLESIFEKFYRVRSGDRRRVGTGLGLAVCRGFVSALGGTIVAGNRSDRSGAVFTIDFPEACTVAEPHESGSGPAWAVAE